MTTAIGNDRKGGGPLEKYRDAMFVRDDIKLYFGNDGDFSIEYDADGNSVVATAGADFRMSDTQTLQFGDGGDVKVCWTGAVLTITGLPGANPNVSDAIWTSGSDLKISSAS